MQLTHDVVRAAEVFGVYTCILQGMTTWAPLDTEELNLFVLRA